MFCTKCGNELREGAKFCLKCGASVDTNIQNVSSAQNHGEVPWQNTYQQPQQDGMQNQSAVPKMNMTQAKMQELHEARQQTLQQAPTVQQPVQYGYQSQTPQPQYQQNVQQIQPKKKGGGKKAVAVIVIIALLVGVLGFWKPGFFVRRDEPGYDDDYYKYITEESGYDTSSGGSGYEYTEEELELLKYLSVKNDPEYIDEPVYLDDIEPYEPIEASISGDYYVADVDEFNTVVTAGDITVDLGTVSGEHEFEILPCYTGEEDSVAWDLTLDDGQTQPEGIVSVTAHYDCDDPYNELYAYREEWTEDGREQIPLPTTINEEDKTVTFYTDHFSVHVLKTIKDAEKLVAGGFYQYDYEGNEYAYVLSPVRFNANRLDEAAMLMDFEYEDLEKLINGMDFDDGSITGGDRAAGTVGIIGDVATVGDGLYNLGMLAKEGAGKALGPVSVALGAVKLGILWYDKGDWRPLWRDNKFDIISLAAGITGLLVSGSAAVGVAVVGAAVWVTSGLSSAIGEWFSDGGRIRGLRNNHYDNDTQRAYMIFTRDYIAYSEAAEGAGWPGGLAYHSVPSMEAYSSACYNLYKQDFYKGSKFLTCSPKIDPDMFRWRSYLMLKTRDYANDLNTMSQKIDGCFADASEVFWKLDPSVRQGFAESIGAKNYEEPSESEKTSMKDDMKKVLSLLNAGNIRYMYNLCLEHAKALTLVELRKLDNELNKVTTLHFMMEDGSDADLSGCQGHLRKSLDRNEPLIRTTYYNIHIENNQFRTTLYHWLREGGPTYALFLKDGHIRYKGSFTYDYGDVNVILRDIDEEEENENKTKEEKAKTEDGKKEDENVGDDEPEYVWVRVGEPKIYCDDLYRVDGDGWREISCSASETSHSVMTSYSYNQYGETYSGSYELTSTIDKAPPKTIKSGEQLSFTLNSNMGGQGKGQYIGGESHVGIARYENEKITTNWDYLKDEKADREWTKVNVDDKRTDSLNVTGTMPEAWEWYIENDCRIAIGFDTYGGNSCYTYWIYECKKIN